MGGTGNGNRAEPPPEKELILETILIKEISFELNGSILLFGGTSMSLII